jgi:putative DNA primase/helicase
MQPNAMETALAYIDRGWSPIPIPPREKGPRLKEWQKLQLSAEEVPRYFSKDSNVGVLLGTPSGGLVDIDLDSPEALGMATVLLPPTDAVFGRASTPQSHRLYRCGDEPGRTIKYQATTGKARVFLELRSTWAQTVFPGSVHPSGELVEWVKDGDPAPIRWAQIQAACARLAAACLLARTWPTPGSGIRQETALALAGGLLRGGWDEGQAREFIMLLTAAACDEEAEKRGEAAVATARRLDDGGEATGWTSLAEHIGAAEVKAVRKWLGMTSVTAARHVGDETEEFFRLSDLGNAERFAEQHGHHVRHCGAMRGFQIYHRGRWQLDETGGIYRLAKKTVRAISEEALGVEDADVRKAIEKHAKASESLRARDAMLKMAAAEKPIPATVEQFDCDPLLLNVLNGTIDLRTGEFSSHRREDFITKIVPVEFDPEARSLLWERFLADVTGGNAQLARYLKRVVGYSLTGDVSDQALFFLWGAGANGKSTLLGVIRHLMGDYGQQAPPDMLLAKRNDQIPNDVARLRGVRFVATVEVGKGKRMAEVLVKQLTGGDTITARFMRAEFFEFEPTFKIWLAANHRPVIRGTDYAIWRRIRLIPFDVKIPREKRDPHLKEKLCEELPAVLAWAVQGCLEWQRYGLEPPAEVVAATEGYRAEEDVFGRFLVDRCDLDEGYSVRASDLRGSLLSWCEDNGENPKPWSARRIASELETRGHTRHRRSDASWWNGLALRGAASQRSMVGG